MRYVLVIAMAITLGLSTKVLDIKGAFVAEEITRDVYVRVDGKIRKLQKFLYGLVDAPKGFNDGLTDHLKKGGYSLTSGPAGGSSSGS